MILVIVICDVFVMNGYILNNESNYANTLSSCGRSIEAIVQYINVLKIHQSFEMALGNFGRICQDYGVIEL